MPLPTNLVSLASDSRDNRLYHQQIHAALTGLGLATTINAGTSGHLTHHEAIHALVGSGLRSDVNTGDSGHAADHNTIHAYVNALGTTTTDTVWFYAVGAEEWVGVAATDNDALVLAEVL